MKYLRFIHQGELYVCLSDVAECLGLPRKGGADLTRYITTHRSGLLHLDHAGRQTNNVRKSRVFAHLSAIRELANKCKTIARKVQLAKLACAMTSPLLNGYLVFDQAESFRFISRVAGELPFGDSLKIPAAEIKAAGRADIGHLPPAVDDQAVAQAFLKKTSPVRPPTAGGELPPSGGELPPKPAVVKEAIPAEQVSCGGETPPKEVAPGRSNFNPPATRQAMADLQVGVRMAGIPQLRANGYRTVGQSFDWQIRGDLLATSVTLAAPGKAEVCNLVAVRFSPGQMSICASYVHPWRGLFAELDEREMQAWQRLPEDVRQLFLHIVDRLGIEGERAFAEDVRGVKEAGSVPRPTAEPAPIDTEKVELYQELALAHREVMPGTGRVVIPNRDVANALGVDEVTLRAHKSKHPELLQGGAHWVVAGSNTPGGTQSVLCWTKDGITILVSELVQTLQARQFLRKVLAAGKLAGEVAQAAISTPQNQLAELKEMLRGMAEKMTAAHAPAQTPVAPVVDQTAFLAQVEKAVDSRIKEEVRLAEVRYEAKLALSAAATRDELLPALAKAGAARPEYLADSKTPVERKIKRTKEFSGDLAPRFCQYWFHPEKMIKNPKDERFCFPPGLSTLVGNGHPDADFILIWMAEHKLIIRVEPLTPEALATLGGKRNWLWCPTTKLIELRAHGCQFWYKWDAVCNRQPSPVVGGAPQEIKGPKWRFSPFLVSHLARLWDADRENGTLYRVAVKHRPSWFDHSKEYLESIGVASKEALLLLVKQAEGVEEPAKPAPFEQWQA